MAFLAAAILGVATVAVVEDVMYSATGVPLWKTWRFQPVSIFSGCLVFVVLLYLLQRINHRSRAVAYVEPYLPLLVLSAANVVLKLNPAWLLPVVCSCIGWSVSRIRRARGHRPIQRRASGS